MGQAMGEAIDDGMGEAGGCEGLVTIIIEVKYQEDEAGDDCGGAQVAESIWIVLFHDFVDLDFCEWLMPAMTAA